MISSTLGNLLSFIYGIVNDYAIAIIVMTLLIKFILFPLSVSQIRATKKMAAINPQLKEIQEKYKDNKEELNKKTMELYSANKINPLSGCLPLLIQLPILFALFAVLRDPTKYVFAGEAQVAAAALAKGFYWVKDLSLPDNIANVWAAAPAAIGKLPGILPIVSALTTFFQMHAQSAGPQNQSTKTMSYMMPLMILYFGTTMSGGLMIYWTVGNIFQIIQQYVVTKVTKEA